MSKKFSNALLIPALGLLPLTQVIATPFHHEMMSSHVTERKMPERPLLGQMLSSKKIQLQMSQAEISTNYSSDKTHIITLMTTEGKQRFVLLTSVRSALVRALTKARGSIKEFDFYPVLDKDGQDTNLFASKRTVTAPANQLTLAFPTHNDARSFFTKENQSMMSSANIFMLAADAQLEAAQQMISAQQELNNQESQEYSQEINQIKQSVSVQTHDHNKSSVVEPVKDFPMASVLVVAVAANA